MSIQEKLLAWVLSVALMMLLIFGVFQYGKHVEGLERDAQYAEEKRIIAESIANAGVENERFKSQLGEQHAKHRKTISNLCDELSDFRLHLPTSSCSGLSNPPGGSQYGITPAWPPSNNLEEALNRFTDGLKSDSAALSETIETCRVVMTWAKDVGKKGTEK